MDCQGFQDEYDLCGCFNVYKTARRGYADGLFLASGRRIPRTGGVILAKCDSRETLQARLSQDPFQQLGLARTEIIPFEASMASPALQSLL